MSFDLVSFFFQTKLNFGKIERKSCLDVDQNHFQLDLYRPLRLVHDCPNFDARSRIRLDGVTRMTLPFRTYLVHYQYCCDSFEIPKKKLHAFVLGGGRCKNLWI